MSSNSEIASTMSTVSQVVSQLTGDGFLVNRVIVGNAQRPTIFLFVNDRCRALISSGRAHYRYIGNHCRIKQGAFEFGGCCVVWSENLIN